MIETKLKDIIEFYDKSIVDLLIKDYKIEFNKEKKIFEIEVELIFVLEKIEINFIINKNETE